MLLTPLGKPTVQSNNIPALTASLSRQIFSLSALKVFCYAGGGICRNRASNDLCLNVTLDPLRAFFVLLNHLNDATYAKRCCEPQVIQLTKLKTKK